MSNPASESPFETAPDVASSSDDYATRFNGPVGQWFLEIQNQGTQRHLRTVQPCRVIDVGGGHGQSIELLLELGHQVTVTGSHSSCASRLESYLASNRIRFEICPLTQLPFDDASHEVVISYRMLTHLEDWRGFIRELTRVSSHRVIVDYPTQRSFNCLNDWLFSWKKGVEHNTRRYHVFREQEVIEAFKAEGFRLRSRYAQFVFPMALHRAHKMKFLAAGLEGLCRMLGLSHLFASPVISCFEKSPVQ